MRVCNWLRAAIAAFVLVLIAACADETTMSFQEVVSRADAYFSRKPRLVTSQPIRVDGEPVYAYFAMEIVEHTISSEVSAALASGTMRVSYVARDNAASGDVTADSLPGGKELGVSFREEPSGFSTTDMALANRAFSRESRGALIIRYFYDSGRWAYEGMEGWASKALVDDLETFPQNEAFRRAVGIPDR